MNRSFLAGLCRLWGRNSTIFLELRASQIVKQVYSGRGNIQRGVDSDYNKKVLLVGNRKRRTARPITCPSISYPIPEGVPTLAGGVLYPHSRVYSEYLNCQRKKEICGNKSNSVDTFIKFILAGKAASHQLQLFTSKPKCNHVARPSVVLAKLTMHTCIETVVAVLFLDTRFGQKCLDIRCQWLFCIAD